MSGSASDDAHVEFERVDMAFGERQVLRGFSCRVPRGKITVILGGSGSGKSTILRLIGGLVRPQRGTIRVDGEEVTGRSGSQLYAVRRKLGMMFQGGALLDSLTVFDNLAFPLREHTRMSEPEIAGAVHASLAAVGLADVDGLLPGQLSGGMVKRVALARAIITKPVILLCDEPFSGLDPVSVRLIEGLLGRVNDQLRATMIVVSHHIASTMRLADWVVLLLPDGAVEGRFAELRRSPDRRVTDFLDEECAPEPAGAEARP
ncbi:MAG TPA: ATP-binding cassette domain-containing protein [Gaiellaceae bacterium]|nr:ATP-binding cassette domain-containing protein [Gaiellaceae bacterium]